MARLPRQLFHLFLLNVANDCRGLVATLYMAGANQSFRLVQLLRMVFLRVSDTNSELWRKNITDPTKS